MTKEQIIDAYNALKTETGRAPRLNDLLRMTEVKRYGIARHFRTWSEMVKEMGDIPGTLMIPEYSDDDFLNAYGEFIREHRRLPTTADWLFYRIKPAYATYKLRFKCLWSELPLLFYSYTHKREEWNDVTEFMKVSHILTPEQIKEAESSKPGSFRYSVHRIDPHLAHAVPHSVGDLVALSYGERSAVEFESRCGDVMRMFGYDVIAQGQGKGRTADGIAVDLMNKYAIIYDAKSRSDKYIPKTDDRAITDYIGKERRALLDRGIEMIYYLIISSGFGKISPTWTFRIQAETGVPVSFIGAENLLRLLAERIRYPKRVDTGKIKELFVNPGEIELKEIKKIVDR
jgi:hypothetical protein